MKVILSGFNIVDPTGLGEGLLALQRIERIARISHRTEDAQSTDSWDRFLRAVVLGHGDWSVTEHVSATVIFTVNRGVTHELVRHRLFGFTQESTRFVNYSKPEHEPRYIPSSGVRDMDINDWVADLKTIDGIYQKWLGLGYKPQIARDFLPNALAADIAVTGNYRNWRHAFLMRTSKETHEDFRKVMIPLLAEFKRRIPLLYDDIDPNQRQIENLRMPR
jgi:thymidylate synthase (FAD)